jgi:hypothetical protein
MIVWLLGYGAPWPTVVSSSPPYKKKLTIQGEIDIIVSYHDQFGAQADEQEGIHGMTNK